MLTRDDKAGLYLTVIVHLVVLIILLVSQIGFSLRKENSFVIDFSEREAAEQQKKEERLSEAEEKTAEEIIDEKINRMLEGTSGIEFRNAAVSRNKGTLKDDRNTDADKLYADAERLAKELKSGYNVDEPDDDYASVSSDKPQDVKKSGPAYSGPSVLSWHLDGRKASHLPIPAYRCFKGGMVTVIISVDNAGKVIDARVLDDVSSGDRCLRDFAVRAARMSRFSSSPSAPARQTGDIVYQFIAQ